MKEHFPHIGLAKICGWFGITRQAYYQNTWRQLDYSIEAELVIKEVLQIRSRHGRIGGRKLYVMLDQFLLDHQIKMGRDALFDLLAANKMLVKRRKRRVYTTHSFHWLRKYPNLIQGLVPHRPNQLWVSDITYWKCLTFYVYVSLITDAYSRMIVGYHAAKTLESIETIQALKMAIASLSDDQKSLIHHSDRGVQYCCNDYVKLLHNRSIQISMTQSGDPLENPIAERANGILKEEYLLDKKVANMAEAKLELEQAIWLYNVERPHMSISNLTPAQVHFSPIDMKPSRLWKNYRLKYQLEQVGQ